jgi:hypothetical protein
MEWLGAVGMVVVTVGIAAVFLMWLDRKRDPVCPWCERPATFVVVPGELDVGDNCGFDYRRDDY